jgi:hypothetical protein
MKLNCLLLLPFVLRNLRMPVPMRREATAGSGLLHHDVRVPGYLLPAAVLSRPYSREAKE